MRLLAALQMVATSFAWHLDLSLTGLEMTPDDLCERGATVANLCGNKLRQAPPCCHTFQGLFIYRNQLERLPDDWLIQCPQLEALSVSDNKLHSLPDRLLTTASRLRRLQASRNALRTLPTGLLHNTTQLQQLDLSNNHLEALPSGFLHDTPNLTELFLQGNSLSSLADDLLIASKGLQKLWLADNVLKALSAAFLSYTPRLRTLHLERNVIEDVAPGAFDSNVQLRFVDLSHNKITALPSGLFAKSASLERLLLNDNLLSVVPPPTTLPQRQMLVDLSYNLLQTVEDLDAAFGQAVVRLDGNKWLCSCGIAPVQRAAASPQRTRWFRGRQICHDQWGGRLRLSEAKTEMCSSAGDDSVDSSQARDRHPAANETVSQETTADSSSLDTETSPSVSLESTSSVSFSPEPATISTLGDTTYVSNWHETSSTPDNASSETTSLETGTKGSSISESNTTEIIPSDYEFDEYEYGGSHNMNNE